MVHGITDREGDGREEISEVVRLHCCALLTTSSVGERREKREMMDQSSTTAL
jgi:hypothetical protein